ACFDTPALVPPGSTFLPRLSGFARIEPEAMGTVKSGWRCFPSPREAGRGCRAAKRRGGGGADGGAGRDRAKFDWNVAFAAKAPKLKPSCGSRYVTGAWAASNSFGKRQSDPMSLISFVARSDSLLRLMAGSTRIMSGTPCATLRSRQTVIKY